MNRVPYLLPSVPYLLYFFSHKKLFLKKICLVNELPSSIILIFFPIPSDDRHLYYVCQSITKTTQKGMVSRKRHVKLLKLEFELETIHSSCDASSSTNGTKEKRNRNDTKTSLFIFY